MKITQTFLKQFREYLRGDLCGNIIKWCWIEGKLIPPTNVMKVGSFFEYHVSGALPKDKFIPTPELVKSGNQWKSEYRKALNDAKYVKAILHLMGLKFIKIGQTLTKGRFEGTMDLICQVERDITMKDAEGNPIVIKAGDYIVVDLKYSGLLDDRYNVMGWMWTDAQKEYHETQAVQYHYITSMPFFYFVTDSGHAEKDSDDNILLPKIKFFHKPVNGDMVERHIIEANDTMDKFEFYRDSNLIVPRPEYNKCMNCMLRSVCADKVLFPTPEIV